MKEEYPKVGMLVFYKGPLKYEETGIVVAILETKFQVQIHWFKSNDEHNIVQTFNYKPIQDYVSLEFIR